MGRPSTKFEKSCERCGKVFWTTPLATSDGPNKYCGRKCYYESQVGRERPNIRRLPEDRPCAACGTLFTVGGRGHPMHTQRFCSDTCKYSARYRHGARANDLSPLDAAYFAGLFDGEGSVILYMRRTAVAMRIHIANTYVPILEWVKETTGVGSVMAGKKASNVNKAGWWWACNAEAAESVLRQIRPYLRIKAEQADLALETQARLRDPQLKADRTWQSEYRERMQAMNRRGPRDAALA